MLLPEGVVGVAAGSRHTLMLVESGDVWAVGNNASGQLGLGPKSGPSSPAPRRIPALAGEHSLNYHLTECGRAHDCQAKGRRFKSRHRPFFNLQTYLLAVVGFVGTWGGILGKQ
jgi:hypothetical protein